MLIRFSFVVMVFMGNLYATAEEPKVVGALADGGIFAADTMGAAKGAQVKAVKDYDKSCSCRCTAQGILLRECEGETENLGNYGNIANCNLHKEKNPQCN